MRIQVLGTGCARCRAVAENARRAVAEAGIEADVEEVQDVEVIMRMGVLMTPAVVIDGKVTAAGRLSSVEEIREMVRQASA
jgi:small redox-active disulfide protein 2